jgi:chemotaxis signal transduction protein
MGRLAKAGQEDETWLLVALKKQTFALPGRRVRELVMGADIMPVAGSPEYVRGVINLRGKVISVVDLRRRLGMRTAPEEVEAFCQMMEQRRQDHVRWLDELKASVVEKRAFTLATNPHECAFGRWYDAYKPEEPWTQALLKRFEEPHGKIHATAIEIRQMTDKGERDAALDLIERTRAGVFSSMLGLFNRLQELIRERHKEIVVVVEVAGGECGMAVDSAVSVEKLGPPQPLPVAHKDGFVVRYAQKGPNELPVLLIDTERVAVMAA